jgi:putative transposase
MRAMAWLTMCIFWWVCGPHIASPTCYRTSKGTSSKWVHDEIGLWKFAWQTGYGAFTLSGSQREEVRKYIGEQEAHHRQKTFQEEYVEFLDRSGIEYDERYLW